MRLKFWKKITVSFIIVAVSLIASQSPAVEFAGGTGGPNNPYQIATAEQLKAIGDVNFSDKNFILVADIDLDPNLPGNEIIVNRPFIPSFSGTLNGNGHSISNMVININHSALENLGLIGRLTTGAFVKNIELRNISIRGVGIGVGALVGVNEGTVSQCKVTGSVSGEYVIGGLVGYNLGFISNCYARGIVTGLINVGGLVGYNFYGFISKSFAMSTITGSTSVGGLVGDNSGDITNCYATGTVVGEKYVGGLIGDQFVYDIYDKPTVSWCYATCKIIADSNDSVGGLIGRNWGQTTDSFWDIQVSGQQTSAGGIGLSTAKLQDSGTYLKAGWDMAGETSNGVADIWTIMESNTYPQLTRLTGQYTVTQLPGSGTADDPYIIATVEDLAAINDYDINVHYALVNDIDMSGMAWTIAPISLFEGAFDGRGHTISNLNIEGSSYLGLFGKILINGIVTNLTIHDAYIVGHKRVGTLAGESFGHITNCHVTGSVTGFSLVGGLVGLVNVPGLTALEDYVFDCTVDVALSTSSLVKNIANVGCYDCDI